MEFSAGGILPQFRPGGKGGIFWSGVVLTILTDLIAIMAALPGRRKKSFIIQLYILSIKGQKEFKLEFLRQKMKFSRSAAARPPCGNLYLD